MSFTECLPGTKVIDSDWRVKDGRLGNLDEGGFRDGIEESSFRGTLKYLFMSSSFS